MEVDPHDQIQRFLQDELLATLNTLANNPPSHPPMDWFQIVNSQSCVLDKWFSTLFATHGDALLDLNKVKLLKLTVGFPPHYALTQALRAGWQYSFWCMTEATVEKCLEAEKIFIHASKTPGHERFHAKQTFLLRVGQVLSSHCERGKYMHQSALRLGKPEMGVTWVIQFCQDASVPALSQMTTKQTFSIAFVMFALKDNPVKMDQYLRRLICIKPECFFVIKEALEEELNNEISNTKKHVDRYFWFALERNAKSILNYVKMHPRTIWDTKCVLKCNPHAASILFEVGWFYMEHPLFSLAQRRDIMTFMYEEGIPYVLWMHIEVENCDIEPFVPTPAMIEALIRRSQPKLWYDFMEQHDDWAGVAFIKPYAAIKPLELTVAKLEQWNPALLMYQDIRCLCGENQFITPIDAMGRLTQLSARHGAWYGSFKQMYQRHDSVIGVRLQTKDRDINVPLCMLTRRLFWLRVFQRKCKRWYDTPSIWSEDLNMWVSRDMLQQQKNIKTLKEEEEEE